MYVHRLTKWRFACGDSPSLQPELVVRCERIAGFMARIEKGRFLGEQCLRFFQRVEDNSI